MTKLRNKFKKILKNKLLSRKLSFEIFLKNFWKILNLRRPVKSISCDHLLIGKSTYPRSARPRIFKMQKYFATLFSYIF
ncbi:MAG: hypothetical protein EBS06_08550 [Proteobacteria bacterium]|nr:hypothetical protein [Pseudomonadota bacterium]